MSHSPENSIDRHTFKKLSRLYVVALSAIAFSVLVSQVLIHRFLADRESDSTVVNIAGRQRMLSQKLTKETLQLLTTGNFSEIEKLQESLKTTLERWRFSHYALLEGSDSLGLPGHNSREVTQMFQAIQPHFLKMEQASTTIVKKLSDDPQIPLSVLNGNIKTIMNHESAFLEGMDRIVNQYEHEASGKIETLGNLELLLMALTLLILVSEFVFIFWPAAKAVRKTIHKLLIAEEKAKKMAKDADVLSEAKDRSVKELRVLNRAINQTLLFARLSPEGEIKELGEKFSRLFKVRKFGDSKKFQELLSGNEEERKQLELLLEEHASKGWQGEVKATTSEGLPVWMEMSLIPSNPGAENREILVIAINITSRKEAQLEIERLTKKGFEEKMNQQKLISSKIIENQEKEQDRIAKDIHDGIGQMLTGLNFNLESIDVSQTEKTEQKIENLKELTSKIIKSVRTATFNLMPPELSDHGIVPALNKLTRELSKLTGKNILLYDKTGFTERMNSLAEINIYRITQEAINNAIKYADSTNIIVTVSHSKSLLGIIIDDNGKGFDKNGPKNKNGKGGMGMTFMRERINYIDGRLFIHSEPGKGTRVTLNIPLAKGL